MSCFYKVRVGNREGILEKISVIQKSSNLSSLINLRKNIFLLFLFLLRLMHNL